MILILGGAGYIGTNLLKKLKNGKESIRVFDQKNPDIGNIDFIKGNFVDIDKNMEIFDGVTCVLHLIHTTLPSTSMDNMIYDVESNVIPTIKVLSLMLKKNVKKMIYISSGGTVYGINDEKRIKEYSITKPICSYGITKLVIEKYIEMYTLLYGINGIILRVSNPYGNDLLVKVEQGVIPIFLRKILKDEVINIWGSGDIIRDFIHIDDVMIAMEKIINNEIPSGVYNLGSGKGYSINQILNIMREVLNKKIKIKYKSERNFDIPKVILDIDKISNLLNWTPKIDLKEGIIRMLNDSDKR